MSNKAICFGGGNEVELQTWNSIHNSSIMNWVFTLLYVLGGMFSHFEEVLTIKGAFKLGNDLKNDSTWVRVMRSSS